MDIVIDIKKNKEKEKLDEKIRKQFSNLTEINWNIEKEKINSFDFYTDKFTIEQNKILYKIGLLILVLDDYGCFEVTNKGLITFYVYEQNSYADIWNRIKDIEYLYAYYE